MSDSLKMPVILVARESDRVTTSLRAGFNAGGDLVFEGHDVGSFVEEVWGRDEYEYWLTVKGNVLSHLAKELALLANQPCPAEDSQQRFILDALKTLFTEGESPAQFRSDSEFKK